MQVYAGIQNFTFGIPLVICIAGSGSNTLNVAAPRFIFEFLNASIPLHERPNTYLQNSISVKPQTIAVVVAKAGIILPK